MCLKYVGENRRSLVASSRRAGDEKNITQMLKTLHIQGGPAKVKPTYIFDGNIWMHR